MSTVKAANLQNTASGAPTIKNSSGTEIGQFAKAWVNFNGTGTVAIRDDFNVSSITDNGTGDYTINITTAMANTNYAVCANASLGTNTQWCSVYIHTRTASPYTQAPTASAFRITVANDGTTVTQQDNSQVAIAVFVA